MKELGSTCCVRMKKYRSYRGTVEKIAPDQMKRDFYAKMPNQKRITVQSMEQFKQEPVECLDCCMYPSASIIYYGPMTVSYLDFVETNM